jgi:hypothetical protein
MFRFIRDFRRRHCCASFGLAVLFIPGLRANDAIELKTTAPNVLRERLEAGEVALKDRQAAIASLFAQVGCSVTEQPVTKKFANVICTLPGETATTIIVGGHYDYAEAGHGLVDDWSGTALLVSLYETLRTKPRKHTYKFVAFAAEEQGLVGSAKYVKQLTPEDKENTRAFVNLECLGLSPPKVWAGRSDLKLVGLLAAIANSIHVPLQGVGVGRIGNDDAHSFLSKKIPVISIHSLTQETLPVLHSKRDNLNVIHMDDYTSAYKLAAFYLAYLDSKLD